MLYKIEIIDRNLKKTRDFLSPSTFLENFLSDMLFRNNSF